MEQSDHLIHQEGNRYRQQLEEKEREWTRTYQKELINSKNSVTSKGNAVFVSLLRHRRDSNPDRPLRRRMLYPAELL